MGKILLLTKNYPPQLGGMEKYAFDLHQNLLKTQSKVFLIKSLPRIIGLYNYKILYIFFEFFRLILFFFHALTLGIFFARRVDIIWSADGSISFLGVFIGFFSHRQISKYVTIHGKDISWDFPGYNYLLSYALKHTDKIFAVSNLIKLQILEKYPFLENKVYISSHSSSNISFTPCPIFNKIEFLHKYKIPTDKILLFSLGRFVQKKGFDWFALNVLPFLDKKYHYLLGGFGPLENSILKILESNSINNYTFLGPITEEGEKAKFYSSADYFIMPNIPINNDVEGFGIVLLESNFYNLPIICSDSDNIDQNGEISVPKIVIRSGDSRAWIFTINNLGKI